MAAIKILFLVVIAAFAIAINGRTLPIEKTAADVEMAFLHPHFPPYRGVFGGFRGGAGAGLGGVGAGFGGRYRNGGVGGMYDNGGGFGSGDAGDGAGTGGIGSLESGANSGGDDGGDDVEGGFRP